MILDGHIHIRALAENRAGFLKELKRAGVGGGLVISLPPPAFPAVAPSAPPLARMNHVLSWCGTSENLYPFYWLDPLEADAADQVAMAVKKGARGFKVICDRFFPGDRRAMEIFGAIARARRPILFHSGILWDGKVSSRYNRPLEFEALLDVKGLRFCLAHLSWPWCDECIAVYGKFLNAVAGNPAVSGEMFMDITPGTPPVYRREALTRLFTAGYDVEDNVIFGSDSCANRYNAGWVRQWLERDNAVYDELGLARKTREAIVANNLKRFIKGKG
ncbi:MAG: amidohydrolase family protein [Lentisphaerae bacterium]|nr:amidohydrolase family protein [Lentisphaerota bacterium]